MHLRDNEAVMRQFRRHATPFVLSMIKIIIVSVPFYVLLYFLTPFLKSLMLFLLYLGVSLIFGFIAVYLAFIYFLDRLILTNSRVIFVNWKTLFSKVEHEADLHDIQDIETDSKGFLAKFNALNYGTVRIETASSKTTITFEQAPAPEGIKHEILVAMKNTSYNSV